MYKWPRNTEVPLKPPHNKFRWPNKEPRDCLKDVYITLLSTSGFMIGTLPFCLFVFGGRLWVYLFLSTSIIHVHIPINKSNHTEMSRYTAAKSHLVSLKDVTLFLPTSINIFNQLSSINMLFTFFFGQSISITMLLNDSCSYFLWSQFLAVIFLFLWAICRYVRGSADPSPVHALCCLCSDVTTSCPGLGTN